MTNYYVDISDELADRLQPVEDDAIVAALESLADEYTEQTSDELSQYSSVKEIRQDQSISTAESKRLELKWQRQVGRRQR